MPTSSKFKGHVILTKAQYCALQNHDENKQYFITDLPNGSISNADMALALTTESILYRNGDIFTCLDDGEYKQGLQYVFTENNGNYSWELISILPDDQMSDESENTVQNKVIKSYVDIEVGKVDKLLTYDDYEDMVTDFNTLASTTYKAGQSVYIATNGVPSLWVSSVENVSVPYTYVDDETIVTALEDDGYIQFGYYVLKPIGSTKPDLSGYATKEEVAAKQDKDLVFTNVVVNNWVADNTYADYPYKASVTLTGVNMTMIPFVAYEVGDANSGKYSPVADTYVGGVYLWSKSNDEITIPTIVCSKSLNLNLTFEPNNAGGYTLIIEDAKYTQTKNEAGGYTLTVEG